jgi:hypothetical protein
VSEPDAAPPAGAEDTRTATVRSAVASWTRHLVDLGGRNTLLWFRDLPTGTLELTTAHPGGIALLMTGRPTKLSDIVREPAAFEEARRRTRAIATKARELKEERGIETCFVAFGMATWDLGGAGRAPAAPVLLRSATLRAIGAAADDYVLDLGDHIELNPVLEHYLKAERGLAINSDALEALAVAGAGFDPHPVYAALAEECLSVPGFAINPRVVMGTFSYAKLPMVADLAAQGDALADHDVIAALAGDPAALASVRSDLKARAEDPVLDDTSATLVLDADSSQQDVIEAARTGAHLVIQGPPGTGKSQTIANLVAALAADGKRVLFVAEKRAAIEAVAGRLDRVGLGSLVLDLHDGARAKRRIAVDFADALAAAVDPTTPQDAFLDGVGSGSGGGGGGAGGADRARRESATALADHLDAMHEVRSPWGVSAHEAMSAVTALNRGAVPPRSTVRLRGEHLAGLSAETREATARELGRLAALGAWQDDGGEDPWFGARLATADDAVAARDRVERLHGGGLDRLEQTLRETLAGLRFPEARSVADWGRTLSTLAHVRDTLETFRPEVFDAPLEEAVVATAPKDVRERSGIDLGWWERRRIVKAAKALLRPGPPPRDLHAALEDAATQRTAWRELAGAGGRPEIPADLDRARAAHDAVLADLAWLDERLPARSDRGPLADLDRADLVALLGLLAATPDRLAVVPTVRAPLDALVADGWGPLVEDLAARGVDAQDVPQEVAHVWWTSIAEDIALRDPRIGGHSAAALEQEIDRFASADREVLSDNVGRVLGAVRSTVRRLALERPDQAAQLRTEGSRRRALRPIRDMLPIAGDLMTALRPCWAMSPLVVAGVLPPGRWFDVVVFDEASQIPPAEAISAISRARQVVLAGDSHQLPPTTFFTTAPDDDAATGSLALTEGVESILDVLTASLPSRHLRWHYRSRDERLIAFVNDQIYDEAMVTFPGTATDPVLTLDVVDGQGMVDEQSASVETTRAEVGRVVGLVIDHATNRPEESLGVITLGLVHAVRIEEALRVALAGVPDHVAAFFAEDAPERFFIKNLERVQGDERDAIILSIGYGKTPHGRVLHRFGPLNLDGGERRLNVAITRARQRMTVVSALQADDLDPARLKARGALMLRDFLAYAAGSRQASGAPTAVAGSTESTGPVTGSGTTTGSGAATGSDALVDDLARRLTDQGLVVHRALGASRDRIDLAVEDPSQPGRLAVAVQSDGPAYAAIPRARDRDRLREEQLRRLGWRTMRVWGTDIYRDPAPVVERIRAAADTGPAAAVASERAVAAAATDADATESDATEPHATEPHERTDG